MLLNRDLSSQGGSDIGHYCLVRSDAMLVVVYFTTRRPCRVELWYD
jgi:hypothetical protein